MTDNGKEFTDQLCAELGIEHRLTLPKLPQTNGIPLGDCGQSPAGQRVEHLNGCISEVLKTNRFDSAFDLEQTLMRYSTSTTRSCRNQPWRAKRRCRR